MPLEREVCEGCAEIHTACPECGSSNVTPRDNPGMPSPSRLIDFEGESEVTYKHVCWNCGWDEYVVVEINRQG